VPTEGDTDKIHSNHPEATFEPKLPGNGRCEEVRAKVTAGAKLRPRYTVYLSAVRIS
jgi:hypothetical protein